MSERENQYPYPLATRVDERVYSIVKAEAEKRRESESAVLRRVLESWAVFGSQEQSNSGNTHLEGGRR